MGKVTIDSQIQAMLEADDSSALELIWDRYADALFGYLVSLLRSRHDAEDVQQTVFVQIARSHQLVAKAGCLKSYLFSMARNAAANFTRQRKRNERLRAECDVWLQYICRISAPSGPKIEELRDALQRCDDIGPLVSAMDGERLLFGDWFFRRASSGMTDEDAESLGIPPWLFWLGPAVRADHAEYLDIMRQYADWASRPYAAEDEGIGDRLVDQVPFYCIQTRLIVPSLSGAKTAYLRMIAHTRITRAGLAVIGAAGDDGSCPKTLAEAGIDAPIDPFTGKPLVYRAEGKGFVLYSTGKDRVDDGGTVSEDVNEAGKDIVWRFSGTGRSLSDG